MARFAAARACSLAHVEQKREQARLPAAAREFPADTSDENAQRLQRDPKCGALVRRALRPRATAVAGENARDDRESHAGAFERGRGVEPVEHTEELVVV